MEIFWVEDDCDLLGCQNIEVSIILFQLVCVCRVTPAGDTLSDGAQNGGGAPDNTASVFAPTRETKLPYGR